LGFAQDNEFSEAEGIGVKALSERFKRIEARFGAIDRR